jgi:hypothetical protein
MTATLTTEPDAASAPLDERIAAACGQLNACYAQLVGLLAEVIASGAWAGHGIRSAEQWIGWRTGLSAAHCRTLAALVAARQSHPRIVEAFTAGELSIDQAGLAIKSRPENDGDVAEMARVMTLSQLRVVVRASNVCGAEHDAANAKRHAEDTGPAEDTEPAEDTDADEGEPSEPGDRPVPAPASGFGLRECLSLSQDEDGSWRLHGRFDGDHGAVLDAALAEARDRLFRDGQRDVTWVDALVDIAERSLDGTPVERRERYRVNLFLDPALTAAVTWINGIAMPDAIARLYTCDGTINPTYLAEGHPVNVGRSQRIVPDRTRRIVIHRDKQCRNPLCAASRGLEVHHIIHWHDGGRTDTNNLVALCRRCHRDHHLGRLDITGNADQPDGVTFRDQHGRPIDTATHAHKPPGPPPDPLRPLPPPPRRTPPTLGHPVQPAAADPPDDGGVADHADGCPHAVAPADLLALGVGAPAVGDADLVDPPAAAGNLRGELRLDAEAVLLDGDAFDDVAAEALVARLHVREVEVGEHVGQQRERPVAERVPEVQDAMGSAAEKARPEHDVGDAFLERFEEHVVLAGVVLEVGILDDDVLAGDSRESAAQRRPFATIALVGHNVEAWIAELGNEIGEHLRSAVG